MNYFEKKLRRIISEEIEKVIDRKRILTEYARIGFLDTFEIIVHTDDPGYIPHVHIVDRASKGNEFDCCVQLNTNQYFSHGRHRDTFNSKGCKAFNQFMRQPCKAPEFKTNYEYAVHLWNMNNSDEEITINKDENGNIIIPDYTRILPYG